MSLRTRTKPAKASAPAASSRMLLRARSRCCNGIAARACSCSASSVTPVARRPRVVRLGSLPSVPMASMGSVAIWLPVRLSTCKARNGCSGSNMRALTLT
ncbi:hypothetical protein D3C79_707020 [compost metagenome]